MEHIPKEKKRAKNRRACPLPWDESQLPVHYSAGEPRLEIIGDRVLVDGLRRVLSYTSERLVLQVGKRRVTLVGADLCLLDYSPLGVAGDRYAVGCGVRRPMTRLYWYLRGYVQFVFTGGFAEDFINALGSWA